MSPDKGKRSKVRHKQTAPTPARTSDPGPPYVVRWHPDADAERDASWPAQEKVAMLNAVQKLSRPTRALQRDLAKVLGMEQPQVARLERGDVNPGMDTLMRVASGLGIEFTINVRPAGANARLVTKKAQTDSAVGVLHTERAEFLVAAA
jgi:transcriptional regulator with XRE-family HTH domain